MIFDWLGELRLIVTVTGVLLLVTGLILTLQNRRQRRATSEPPTLAVLNGYLRLRHGAPPTADDGGVQLQLPDLRRTAAAARSQATELQDAAADQESQAIGGWRARRRVEPAA